MASAGVFLVSMTMSSAAGAGSVVSKVGHGAQPPLRCSRSLGQMRPWGSLRQSAPLKIDRNRNLRSGGGVGRPCAIVNDQGTEIAPAPDCERVIAVPAASTEDFRRAEAGDSAVSDGSSRAEIDNSEVGGRPDPSAHGGEELQIGNRWREIQGAGGWDGLLDPLDTLLRSELLRYGDLAQVTYDAFDRESKSPFCGSCKFSKRNLFQELRMDAHGYEVRHYLYATTSSLQPSFLENPGPGVKDQDKWSLHSNWIGYVAVCTSPREIARLGRRDIVVVWRGTVTNREWLEHLENAFIPKAEDPHKDKKPNRAGLSAPLQLKVEEGFLDTYLASRPDSRYSKTSAREQVLAALQQLLERYEDEEISITVTGHSLGGALATLCAYDIVESGLNRRSDSVRRTRHHATDSSCDENSSCDIPITVFTYASPRVGNNAFRDRLLDLGVKVLRVVNVRDVVPQVPGLIFNEKMEFLHPRIVPATRKWLKVIRDFLEWLPVTYAHVGVELALDNLVSPYLKKNGLNYQSNAHNLEVYLHLLDGFIATDAPFTPSDRRCLALVNKFSDFLIRRLRIPPFWWQEKNKGLVKDADRRWVRRPRELPDYP